MKGLLKKVILIIVCTILAGCGINQSSGGKANYKSNVPMGRYVEESAGLDGIVGNNTTTYLWLDNQGRLQALVKGEVFENYQLSDSGDWEISNTELSKAINEKQPKTESIGYIKQIQDGTYYLSGDKRDQDGKRKTFVATFDNNEIKEIDMEWQEEEPIVMGVVVDSNGNIVIGDHVAQNMQVYSSEGKLEEKLGDEVMTPALVDDTLVGMGNNKVEFYDTKYNCIKKVEDINCSPRENNIFSNGTDRIFITTSAGIVSIDKEGNFKEEIIESGICSLSAFSSWSQMIYNDEIYIVYSGTDKHDNEWEMLKKLVYHKDVPTNPEQVLTIWSVRQSWILQAVVKEYKRQHPDVYIKFETLYNDEQFWEQQGDVKSDDLETLSTQILAGEGPDLILLDGLPIESYRKQGILADLTECLEKNKNKGELLNNVVTSYSQDGKVYAIPLEFSIITAIGDKKFLQNGLNLKEIATYQEAHPDEQVMNDLDGRIRVRLMADYFQSQLFDKQGKVNREKMAEYLETIKSVVPAEGGYGSELWRNTYQPESYLLSKLLKVDIAKVTSLNALQSMAFALHQLPDCMITDQIEGEKNIVQGVQLVAINQNSKNKEIAEDIIGIALSEEVQGSDYNDGLPVNIPALEEKLLYNNHDRVNRMIYGHYTPLGDGEYDCEIKDFEFGYPEEMQYFIDQSKKAKVIKPLDEAIRDIMKQETEAYFEDKLSLEETVNNLEKKINLYVSEQTK